MTGRFTLGAFHLEGMPLSTIDIHARHRLSHADAQRAADELSQDLAEKFGIDYGWDGDLIYFERPGVHGQILVQDSELRIQAHLGKITIGVLLCLSSLVLMHGNNAVIGIIAFVAGIVFMNGGKRPWK